MSQASLVEARLGVVLEGVSGSDNASDLLAVVFSCPWAVWERHPRQRPRLMPHLPRHGDLFARESCG